MCVWGGGGGGGRGGGGRRREWMCPLNCVTVLIFGVDAGGFTAGMVADGLDLKYKWP